MISFERADNRLLDDLTEIVEELVTRTGIDPDQLLVVGAGCRDIMHSALGYEFPLRGTSDTDLGIAVADWALSEDIERLFPRTGDTGIRYLVAGLPVDIMPFGGIEDPDGISSPAPRGEELVVFGFSDVYDRAHHLMLPSGARIRIPSIAGYVALKLRSWLDRSAYGEDKDAKDLAVTAFWYRESRSVEERLYRTDSGNTLLESTGWDVPLAAPQLLGMDAAQQLSQDARDDLGSRWSRADLDSFARGFVLPPGGPADFGLARRSEIAQQLITGLTLPAVKLHSELPQG